MSLTRPDILFIMTDQQRFDTIAALGNSHIYTPNLDRLGRRTVQLLQLIEALKARGIGFKSLSNAIDTTTPEGMFIYRISSSFAREGPTSSGQTLRG